MPSHHPRCVQHGLVVATDNMCVLCRKEARASQRAKKSRHRLPLTAAELTAGGVVGLLRVVSLLTSLLLLMAGGAYFIKAPPSARPIPQPSAANAEAADATLPEGVGEIDHAEAADLAASLALLEADAEDRERAPQADPRAAQPAEAEQAGGSDPAHTETATREPDIKPTQPGASAF